LQSGDTPLHIVAENGHAQGAEVLLSKGTNIHVNSVNKVSTPMHSVKGTEGSFDNQDQLLI